MPTFGVYFPDDESPAVERAAQSAGQKLAPYLADAARMRMRTEGMMPGTPEAEARHEFDELLANKGPDAVRAKLAELVQADLAEAPSEKRR